MNLELLKVSSSPHIRSKDSVSKIMLDVILALLPAAFIGIYVFGLYSAIILLVSVLSAVLAEYLFNLFSKRPNTITDLSAVVTGLLLGMNLPPTVPLWIPVLGSFFAVIIVKQLFGGLGQNFMNPALAARIFLMVSYAKIMTTWTLDGVSSATPLGIIKEGGTINFTLASAFIGNVAGCIGETSALALLIGGIYLIARKVISYRIPFFYIVTVGILTLLLGGKGLDFEWVGIQLFTGGLMIGAFFMATDYATSPISTMGQIIYAVGCGLITVLIRFYGGYPEGVSFSIVIMNLLVPLMDKYIVPRIFGEVPKNAKK